MKDSKWECFCDESYYSKWAVRNENDKSFQASIHVGTQEESDFLVTSLNNLQQYREALEAIRHLTASGVEFPTIHEAHKIARNALKGDK